MIRAFVMTRSYESALCDTPMVDEDIRIEIASKKDVSFIWVGNYY